MERIIHIDFKSIKYELFLACFLSWSIISGAVHGITRNLLPMGKVDTLLLYSVMLLLFLKVFGVFFKRLKVWQLVFPIGILSLLLFAMLFSPMAYVNQGIMIDVIVFCIPCFLLAGCVRDFSSLYKYLLLIMQIAPYFHIIAFFFLGNGELEDDESYSQSMSYLYLFSAVVLLSDILSKFSLKSFVPFAICVFLIIAYGSRGPLASLLLFAFLYWLVMARSIGVKKLLLPIFVFAGIATYVFIHMEEVLSYLLELMSSMNTSVRVVNMMMSENESVVESESRIQIIGTCLGHVFDNPFWCTGPVNDRIFIWQLYHIDPEPFGSYPHNFFVEVLTQYGLILGLVIISFFLLILYKSLKYAKNIETQKILLVFIGAFFFPLMFSGSYIDAKGFYILFATSLVIKGLQKEKLTRYVVKYQRHNIVTPVEA